MATQLSHFMSSLSRNMASNNNSSSSSPGHNSNALSVSSLLSCSPGAGSVVGHGAPNTASSATSPSSNASSSAASASSNGEVAAAVAAMAATR